MVENDVLHKYLIRYRIPGACSTTHILSHATTAVYKYHTTFTEATSIQIVVADALNLVDCFNSNHLDLKVA